ncbi:PAS domain S-box protein [Nostoc sp. KVJ3]|uniref:PAS domain-containing sensor histidine kinase n=1 Tax=Nostoc sp. KVJ3 TaxID=457945 RepID=UPI002237DF71|nr:PAS domain-containing sensor histidine kinase [Nostoc sp. KVJ3]MCW5315503.1 PAS domain S-box protein [Nostoc sp. KVJ3]
MVFNNLLLDSPSFTEKQIKEEDLQLTKSLMNYVAEAIFLLGSDGKILYCNNAACCLFGYSCEELLIQIDLFQQIKFKDSQQIIDYLHFTVPEYQEVKLLTKNGEECWLDYSLKVIEFAGKPATLVTAVDITKHKQAEEKIKQLLEREKELGENRIHLLSMVSHELRVPLNIISFCTNLLKCHSNDWSKKKIQDYINRLQKGVEMLSLLIDEVLIIGKAETGKLKFEPKPLDLLQFCHNLLAELYPNESYQNFIRFGCKSDCLSVSLDKIILQIILTNLLENAIKYSPSGNTVDFIVSCQGGKVIFEIKDRGIGITDADQQRLFEPFYRGTNVDNLPGNGLGLAIVKNLVDIHGGEITVKSQVGVGTEFVLALPTASIPLP